MDDETARIPKAVSDEYNEKTLKRMGYELIGNKWTPKQTKKIEKGGSSKGKERMESEEAEEGGFEVEMRSFMSQMSESIKLLHTKVDNMAFRLVICEKKIRNLSNMVRKGKKPLDDSESTDEEEENKEVEGEESKQKEKEEKEAGDEEEKGMDSNADIGDSSETDLDATPLISRTASRRYSTRS